MRNKKGILGEGIAMMYRLVLVSFIAFIILGISSVYYAHYIDVRDAEARIMTVQVVECISPKGVFNYDLLKDAGNVLIYCGFDKGEVDRFFVRVKVSDSSGKILELTQGDSGKLWVRKLFDKVDLISEGIGRYEPGYFEEEYVVDILKDGFRNPGEINVEVLVSDEF